MGKNSLRIIIAIYLVMQMTRLSFASIFNGTDTFPKNLIILVHGIGANCANWTDKTYSDIEGVDINDIDNSSRYGGFKKHLKSQFRMAG